MSRRKQAKPIRHSDEFGVEQCVIGNKSENELCVTSLRTEGVDTGRNKNGELHVNGSFSFSGDRTGTSVSGSVSPTQDESESEQEQEDRLYEDSTNNNQSRKRERDFGNESSDEDNRVPESTSEALRMANPFLNGNALEAAYSPYLPPAANLANVNNALDALQNTRMAIAQFAATAFASGAQNPNALQELASLQSTLYALHQQQFLQMQLIHQLQQQLHLSNKETGPEVIKSDESEGKQMTDDEPAEMKKDISPPQVLKSEHELPNNPEHLPSLADSILQTSEPLPAPDAPSTLEMLQRSTQQVLNNASQGLLSSNLADELGFRAASSVHSGDGKGGKDSMFKHRCRYCGKVFSSDSALQIHIRSHTGERPFKCNICGNRFTTKGNLKVHFQRHAARFPHVKMNPHPVPEHLDRFHPPLLAQLEMDESSPSGAKSPGSNGPVTNAPLTAPGHNFPRPPMGVIPNFPSPLYRSFNPDLIRARQQLIFNPEILEKEEVILEQQRNREQELPENLTKISKPEESNEVENPESTKLDNSRSEEKEETKAENGEIGTESLLDARCRSFDECSIGSKYSSDEGMNQDMDDDDMQNDSDDAPENLSSKTTQMQQPMLPSFLPPHLRFPLGMPVPTGPMGQFREGPPLLHTSQGPILLPPDVDPAKDPAIYTNLLPRPGSNDNAWESLIEVTKASETTKLQQLVDSIENKLTDPNQCVICHRVLSCKSALQMHYRTHTGERPFKCKICGRAFTTKGNLKTHMGVHRAKPPTRLLHICPVCHRKFTNGIVLQQHIRLHTGEPTDLTHEQIQAAEVRDFPMFPMMGGYPNPFFGMPPFGLRLPMEDGEKSLNFCIKGVKTEVRPGSPQESNASEVGAPLASPSGSERRQDSLSEREEKKMSLSESESSHSDEYRAKSSQSSFTPLDLTSMSHYTTVAMQGNAKSPRSSPLSSLTNTSLPTTFNPLNLPVAPGRGNTTCNICFKTFACHSALEIHYRSHTKERPFKCTICDRGFSTKGNMKQHMMTHKAADGELPKISKSLPPSEGSQDERPNSQQSLPDSRVNFKYELDADKDKMHAFSVFAQFRHKDVRTNVQTSPVGYWGNFIKQEGDRRLIEGTSPHSQVRLKDPRAEEESPSSPPTKSLHSPDYLKPGVYGLSATNPASELDLSTKNSINFAQHANRHMLPLP